jgi:8-amino-7-oxononanoate synthase
VARLLEELAEELDALRDEGLFRVLTVLDAVDGPRVRIGGRELVSWCSNDYLGLAAHPALAEAAARAAAAWGVGARASRLLAGTSRWHARLEDALAAWFGADAAVVFSSGYLANLGVLGSLASSRDTVVIDRLAHASLFDAARATRATLRVFRHNDAAHAAELLSRASAGGRRFMVTEGVFSMDGDGAPLAELADVAERTGALVYLDDAHGSFVTGPGGRGSPEAAGVPHARFLYMGALGKALGGQGGFVAGPATLVDYLRNRARTFIYSTAPAVPVAAAAVRALEVMTAEPQRRDVLRQRIMRLHDRLTVLPGLSHLRASHILPIMVGDTDGVAAAARRLRERGCWVPAIRPPTVPEGTARLRLSVTALHADADIDALADALEDTLFVRSPESVVGSKGAATDVGLPTTDSRGG